MCAICDVNEYRKCVKEFKIPLVNTLFETLHALCNLLLVKPENLKQVCNGDQLVSHLFNFVFFKKLYLRNYLRRNLKWFFNVIGRVGKIHIVKFYTTEKRL